MNTHSSRSLLLRSNLVSFIPGVPSESRADILDVLLLAELSASELHKREAKWEPWLEAYTRVLLDSGIVRRSSLTPKPVKVSNESGFRRETAKLIRTIRPAQLANVAQAGLADMFSSEHARHFFSSWFSFNSGRSDSFQIVPCERAVSGEIHIALCGLQMRTRTRVKPPNFFFPHWPLDYEMTLTLRGGGLVFDSSAYEQHRERVQRELFDRGGEGIKPIEF
ncbi:hypothetical protein [Pseudomonas sp. DWP3-1-2]|uniref:hypothetical protein n=1 Tax=Pseudomonas sp. DWP3-1-2 TaxID=2804645 RepID=UPI003CF9F9B7